MGHCSRCKEQFRAEERRRRRMFDGILASELWVIYGGAQNPPPSSLNAPYKEDKAGRDDLVKPDLKRMPVIARRERIE